MIAGAKLKSYRIAAFLPLACVSFPTFVLARLYFITEDVFSTANQYFSQATEIRVQYPLTEQGHWLQMPLSKGFHRFKSLPPQLVLRRKDTESLN